MRKGLFISKEISETNKDREKYTLVFYDVDIRRIESYTTKFSVELKSNGYEILKGKSLKQFFEDF